MNSQLQLQISAIDRQADGVVSLELRAPDRSALPAWTPGAHIEVHLDMGLETGMVRHYSLCGRPDDDTAWRIAVLREPAGRGGSSLIHDRLRPGDVISVRAPRNNFELVESDRYLFIAGGIGITPILPMVRDVARRGRPWTLVYGGRTAASMAFVDELSRVPGGHLHVMPEDEYGLLDLEHFLGRPDADTAVYCCGPGPLLDAVERHCGPWPAAALHVERFSPKQVSRECADGEFDVRLAQSGESLRVPQDKTLLEVLEEAGYQIDNSCRAGICGTCELNVTEGVPEHNDDVLSDEERDSNQIILPCVSRSKSAVLVVDL